MTQPVTQTQTPTIRRFTKALVLVAWCEFVAKYFDDIIAAGMTPAETLINFEAAMRYDDPVVTIARHVVLPRQMNTPGNVARWREQVRELRALAKEGAK